MVFPPNVYLTESSVIDAISRLLVYRGETSNTASGLGLAKEILTMKEYGIRSDIPKTILVISAGSPDDVKLASEEAALIKAANIRIIAVGIGLMVSLDKF